VLLLTNRVNPTRANTKIGAVRQRLADAVLTAMRWGTIRERDAEHPPFGMRDVGNRCATLNALFETLIPPSAFCIAHSAFRIPH
jgi:hypothetical protein